jgi:hypothetical protein
MGALITETDVSKKYLLCSSAVNADDRTVLVHNTTVFTLLQGKIFRAQNLVYRRWIKYLDTVLQKTSKRHDNDLEKVGLLYMVQRPPSPNCCRVAWAFFAEQRPFLLLFKKNTA